MSSSDLSNSDKSIILFLCFIVNLEFLVVSNFSYMNILESFPLKQISWLSF